MMRTEDFKTFREFELEVATGMPELFTFAALFEPVETITNNLSLRFGKVYQDDKGYTLDSVLGITPERFVRYFTVENWDRRLGYDYTSINEGYNRTKYLIEKACYDNGPKWIAMLETFASKYKPAENYNMVERSVNGRKVADSTGTTTPTGSISNINSANGNIKTVTEFDSNQFNNTDYVKDNRTTTLTGPEDSDTYEQVSTTEYNDYTTTSQSTNKRDMTAAIKLDSGTETLDNQSETNEHILTRSGNIGVTTTQQMLESEIQLKSMQILETVIEDINKEIALRIWG